MGLISTIQDWLARRPSALPAAPKPPDSAPRIRLGDGDLRWDSMEAVRKALKGKGTIKGTTVDLGGAVLLGSAITHPENRQDENSRGIEISIPGFVMVRGWVDDVPGGIEVQAPDCRFSGLTWIRIGEDAISTTRTEATGLKLTNCDFWNQGGDKTIQLNQALGAVLTDLGINYGITALRVQKAKWKTPHVIVLANNIRFAGMECGINIDGGATVRLGSPQFKNVRQKWVQGTNGGGGKVVIS